MNPFATKKRAYFNYVCQFGQLPSSDVVVSLINAVAWPFYSRVLESDMFILQR